MEAELDQVDGRPVIGPERRLECLIAKTREYGPDTYPAKDREFGHPDEAGVGKDEHVHDWDRPPGGGKPKDDNRGPPRPPNVDDPPPPRGPNTPPSEPEGGPPPSAGTAPVDGEVEP